MRNKACHIIFISCLLIFWGYAGARGEEAAPSEHELALMGLINEARQAPLAMASALGMDPEQVLKDLPELEEILKQGLPPLSFNDRLYQAARDHTHDMLRHLYYSHQSPDGRTYDDRIRETGYDAITTGESLGLLGFRNFIKPGEAVQRIFSQIFLEELKPAPKEKRCILDPQLREVGVSISGGPYTVGDMTLNVYVATCDFATPNAFAVELGVFRLINEARRDPGEALARIGVDARSARKALGSEAWVLDKGLAPLAWNENLREAAQDHALDMVRGMYFDSVSPEGIGPEERIESTGYEAETVGETLGVFMYRDFDNPMILALILFDKMLQDELNPALGGPINILNPNLTEVAVKVETAAFDVGESEKLRVYLLVVDFARPEAQRFFVVGNVYRDLDEDGSLGLGEGAAGLKVTLTRPGEKWTRVTYTGLLGSYQVPLSLGSFRLEVQGKDGEVLARRSIFGFDRNLLEDMQIEY